MSSLRPFYTSQVIRFRSGFNPDWTGFVPSTLKPLKWNQWFQTGLSQSTCDVVLTQIELDCQSLWVDSHDSITDTNKHTTCNVLGMALEELKSKETRALLTVWGKDRIQPAINGCKQRKRSAYFMFCFVLFFLSLKRFTWSPFSTFQHSSSCKRNEPITAPEILHNPQQHWGVALDSSQKSLV